MAASAFMQARHEAGKHAVKAAVYTGISYLVVVILLIAPFVIFTGHVASLFTMGLVVLSIILAVSYYTATLLNRRFVRQLCEMFLFSVGVAVVAFLLGIVVRKYTSIAL